MQPYSHVSSTLALSLQVLSSKGAPGCVKCMDRIIVHCNIARHNLRVPVLVLVHDDKCKCTMTVGFFLI